MWPPLAAACAVAALLLTARGNAAEGPPTEAITVPAQDYASTKYLSADEIEQIKKRGYLTGFGEAEYRVAIPRTGWYELWVAAAQWSTELRLDGEFVIYTPFASGVWPAKDGAEKTVNLYLTAGNHLLRFSRPWPFGLPWMKQFVLQPARDVTGMVRMRPTLDTLALRQGQAFGVELTAGKLPEAYTLNVRVQDPNTAAASAALPVAVPAGEGLYRRKLTIPTDREGIFDIAALDAQGRAVDRIIQYCVVGRARTDQPSAALNRQLLTTIDCARQAPDYVSAGGTHLVAAAFGSYVESGPKGRVEDLENADWFAYRLDLPEVQQPYLVEVDYPDDDQRAFLISLVEEAINPYAPTLGVASGGEIPLSEQMQTHQLVFYPRQKDPRLFFQTWYRGQRAAAGKIRVYRLRAPFPVLPGVRQAEREFGFYQEEPLRFGSYFGAPPTGNQWSTVFTAADRLGQWGNYLGANLWHPTIAVYQSMMWPSKVMPGYGPADTDGYGLIGPPSLKEPLMKDLVRLMLLISEKYGMKFVGELHIPVNAVLARALDKQFGGTGATEDDGPQKPWLIVSKEGKIGACPHFNPLHPGVEGWVASVIGELAQRYKDSPAFGGVALRFMGWQFSSWQGLPSINWGYEDYTVGLFEKETGVEVPVAADDPQRYGKRHAWLMSNAYESWVSWRCRKMHEYYQRLAGILTSARPDLRLHLETYGQTFDTVFSSTIPAREYESKGWLGLMRESGIDPALFRGDRGIVLNDTRAYPPAIRTAEPLQAAADRAQYYDPQVIAGVARPQDGGTVSAVHFDAQSMEGEMVRADRLGLPTKMMLQNKETAHGAGVMNPAGRHFLARYADALADGNVTYMHDGSHGYAQGQPQYLRDFLTEYLALPAVGMNRLAGTGDPVAVWCGRQGDRAIFYVVNRSPFVVTGVLSFAGKPSLKRLATGTAAPLEPGGKLRLSLQGYQLLAFGGGTPTALAVTAPPEIKGLLERQMAFAEALLAGKGPAENVTIVPFSLIDKQRALDALAQAQAACREGRFVTARRLLMQPALVKVYEAFGAYPPDLVYRKSPPVPEQALTPQTMLPELQGATAWITPAVQVAPELAGEEILTWREGAVSLPVEAPVPNRYRLSFAYVNRPPYARPRCLLDGQYLPGQETPTIEEDGTWGRITLGPPVSLSQGAHRLELRPQGPAPSGLLYLHLQPVYRALVASDWRVIGPFASEQVPGGGPGRGMAIAYGPEIGGTGYSGDQGQPLRWIHPTAPDEYINLHQLTGAYNWRVGYAATTIGSAQDQAAVLQFGVDYWARIWLNGQQVFELLEGHGPPCRAQYTVPIHLRQGANRLLVKIHAGSAGNGFWLSISDPGDLRVQPEA